MADPNAIRAGKAVVELSGDDSKLKAATQRSQKYLQDLGKAGRDVGGAAQGGFLDRLARNAKEQRLDQRATGETALQQALGSKNGAAGFIADSLGVGLQAMVAQAIGSALRSATDQAIQLKEQLRQGKITEEELYRGLATGVPILGDFVAGFLNIRELVTGERAEIERINQETKRGAAAMDAKVKAAERYRDILRQITTEAARSELAIRTAGADEYTKEREAIAHERNELQPKKLDLETGLSKRADEYMASIKPALDAAEQKLKEAELARSKEREDMLDHGIAKDVAQKKYDDDPAARSAKAELARLREEVNNRRAQIITEEKQAIAKAEQALAVREQQNIQKRAKDMAQATADVQRAVDAALTAGAAQRLRSRGREYEAEMVTLRAHLHNQIAAIDKAEKDRIQKFGLKAGTDEYNQAARQAEQQRAAARSEYDAKAEAASAKEFDRKRQEALELRQLQNAAIQDRRERELAELNARYQAEIDTAQNAGRASFQIYQKWEQEKANLEERHRQERSEMDREETLRLQEIQLQGIENRNARELASIDARYQAEISTAKANPGARDVGAIEAQWAAERAQAEQRQARETADAIREIDLQIERERTAIQKRGLAERLAQIEIDRKAALQRETDPRTTTGVGADKINELFDLRAQRELMGRGSAAGSFSAAELSRMGNTGPMDEIAKHTKETAENTRRMSNDGGLQFGA